MIKTMNSEMTTLPLSITEPNPPQKQNKNKLSKQLEQNQNHRNRDHMESYQRGKGGGEWGERYRE